MTDNIIELEPHLPFDEPAEWKRLAEAWKQSRR